MKKDNIAHLNGFLNDIIENDLNGKKSFLMEVATVEKYQDNTNEWKNRTTYHKASLVTDDDKVIKGLQKAKKDLDNNLEHRGEDGFKPKTHTVSLDGTLVSKTNVGQDGKTYYNPMIIVEPESFKLDAKLAEGETRNFAEIKGNIASIDLRDDFAVIRIATHFYKPGESENYKGEVKPYTEATSYQDTKIDAKRMPKTFEDLKNGKLAVGDLVSVRGQMHNNRYTDSKDANQNKIVVDLKKFELIAKKGEKKAQSEEKSEKKTEKKAETKKAAPKKAAPRKKGVTM